MKSGRDSGRTLPSVPDRTVRSLFTPPGRELFKPAPLHASSNTLNSLDSDIRTKMAVVRPSEKVGREENGPKWA